MDERNSNQPELGRNDFGFGGNKMFDALEDLKKWMVASNGPKMLETEYSSNAGDWKGYAFVSDLTKRNLQPHVFVS